MTEAVVHVGDGAEPLRIRINGDKPTFRVATDKLRAQALAPIDEVLEDLLYIACTVFAADSSKPRGGATRSDMGAGWRRQFHFTIPVRRPDVWIADETHRALVETVAFLTGDDVRFDFVSTDGDHERQPFLDLDPSGAVFEADEVILFSGGLDSFAGALERLSTSSDKVILLSHRSAQKVIPRQLDLGRYLSDRFPERVMHLQVTAQRVGRQASETTQRSRSLLFGALALVVARTFGARRLNLYENGIVSCNLPISPQVVGTMAARTTHPLGLGLLNGLFARLPVESQPLGNPYQWMTKAEVVERIARHGASEKISKAVSCTNVRDQDTLNTHCGACSQCLDRRFAILSLGLEEHDPAEAYRTDVLLGDRNSERSRVMAVEWTRHALKLRGLDQPAFQAEFGLEIARILRGHPDLVTTEAFRMLYAMHARHGNGVRDVLERAVQVHAGDLIDGPIPEHALLRMLAGGANLQLPQEQRKPAVLSVPATNIPEADLRPDPDAPLEAAFFDEGGRPVVAVRGLGRVEGKPAQPAHELKPSFDQARADGLAPEDHPYQRILPSGSTKDSVRANVRRCRKSLADFFEDLHGFTPHRHLLIQNRAGHGYRLDPELRLVPPGDEGSRRNAPSTS